MLKPSIRRCSKFAAFYRVQIFVLVCAFSCFSLETCTARRRIHWHNLLCLCSITRRGHNIVQSDHAGQHTDGAVHEGDSHTLCPPRSQRHHPQDHGEQTVLRGKDSQMGFSLLHTAVQVSKLHFPLAPLICGTRLSTWHLYHISAVALQACHVDAKKDIKQRHSITMCEVSRLLCEPWLQ